MAEQHLYDTLCNGWSIVRASVPVWFIVVLDCRCCLVVLHVYSSRALLLDYTLTLVVGFEEVLIA